MSYGVGRRRGSDTALLWLWCRPAATSLIKPLAWELPYAMGVALEKTKKTKKKKKKGVQHARRRLKKEKIREETRYTIRRLDAFVSCLLEEQELKWGSDTRKIWR